MSKVFTAPACKDNPQVTMIKHFCKHPTLPLARSTRLMQQTLPSSTEVRHQRRFRPIRRYGAVVAGESNNRTLRNFRRGVLRKGAENGTRSLLQNLSIVHLQTCSTRNGQVVETSAAYRYMFTRSSISIQRTSMPIPRRRLHTKPNYPSTRPSAHQPRCFLFSPCTTIYFAL